MKLTPALTYHSLTDKAITLTTGHAVIGFRVDSRLHALPRGSAIQFYTLYHLRRRASFPAVLRSGPAQATSYLSTFHNHPRALYCNEVVLTMTLPELDVAKRFTAQRLANLHPLSGAELASFLRRTTTFRDDRPTFDGVASLSQAILPYEVFARRGPLATSATFPDRLHLAIATDPPAETHESMLADVLAHRGPLLITAHFAPESPGTAIAAARRILRHQKTGGTEAPGEDDVKDLTRDLHSGNTLSGLMSITVCSPTGHDADEQTSPDKLWEDVTGWLARQPGVDAVATYLSQYHQPERATSRRRMLSLNFLDLITLTRMLSDDEPFGYLEGPSGDIQPCSPYAGDVGHLAVVGPTGTGKSVAMGHLAVCALSTGAGLTLFDQHQGFTTLATAMGGTSRMVSASHPLDNPFAARLSDGLASWWRLFLHATVPGISHAVADHMIKALYALPTARRDMGVLLDLCDVNDLPTDDLFPWYQGSSLASIFHPDNEPLGDQAIEHFDITAVYDQPILLAYLTSRVLTQLRPGRRRILIFDEAWAAFQTEYLRKFLDNAIRVARKLGGALWFATQRPSDMVGWHKNIPSCLFLPDPTLTLEQAQSIAPVDQALLEAVHRATPKRDFVLSRATEWAALRLDLAPLPQLLDLHKPALHGHATLANA